MRGSIARSGIFVMLAAACGDDANHCTAEIGSGCGGAARFAARDAIDLVPSQGEIDRYEDRWSRAVQAEPILAGRVPQVYRYSGAVAIWTTNASAIAAWKSREISTGDAELDAIVDQLRPTGIDSFWHDNGDGSFYFSILQTVHFNEEKLAALLAPTGSWLPDPVQYSGDDGQWSWIGRPAGDAGQNDDTAQVDFKFGWGDCFVACTGYRTVRAVAAPDTAAVVYDLGGDPLPAWLALSPTTRPLPAP